LPPIPVHVAETNNNDKTVRSNPISCVVLRLSPLFSSAPDVAVISRVILIQTYLFMTGCGLVLLGLFAGVDFLWQEDPSLATVMLLPDSAMLAILIGATLLACLVRPVWLRRLPALAAAALCIYSLVHSRIAGGDDYGVSLLSGFLRIRDALALVSLLPALALLVPGAAGRWAARLAGGLMLLIGSLQLLAITGLVDTPFWIGFKFSATLMAVLMSAMIGLGLLGQSFLPRSGSVSLTRLGLVLGLLSALAAAITWHQSSLSHIGYLQANSELLLGATAQHIERSIKARMRLLRRMGERWELRDQLQADEAWLQESRSYLRDHPDLLFITLLDQQLRPVLLDAEPRRSVVVADQLLDDISPSEFWQGHSATRLDKRVHLESQVGHLGLLVMPIELEGQRWLLTAGIDLRVLLQSVLAGHLRPFALRIGRGGQEVLEAPAAGTFLPVRTLSVDLGHGAPWQLESLVNRQYASGGGGGLATGGFVFLLLVGMLLMITQRMSSLAIHRNQLLRRLTSTLRSNLQRQSELHAFNEQIMQHSLDLLCAVDAQGRFLRVSQSASEILGYQPKEMQGRSVMEFLVYANEARTVQLIEAMNQVKVLRNARNRFWHRDGHQVDMMWSAAWDADSEMLACVGRDISTMVVEERFARGQRDVLGMISALQPLPQILDRVCEMIEQRLPGYRASITMVRPESNTLAVLAAPSLPAGYRSIVDGIDVSEGFCCCATAAFRAEAIRVDDVARSELWADYREVALEAGLRSCWCMPMMSQDAAVLGTLSLYSDAIGLPGVDSQVVLICTQLAALALERQQDRAQLVAGEQRYRSLFSYNPDAVFSFDRDGFFTSMNDAGLALTDMTPQQLLGTHFSALVDPAQLPFLAENFDRSMGGEPLRYEALVRSGRGELLELDVSTLPVIINGEVTGVFGVAKDLRGIKAARRKLEQQLEFTQAVTDSLQEGLIATDAVGVITFANPAARIVLDMPGEANLEKLSDWAPLDTTAWSQLGDNEGAGEFERKQGPALKHIAYRVVPMRGDEGESDGWVITLRDRTGEIKAGQALAERDQFFSLSLDMFCMISLKGLFVQLNPAMLTALGYLPEEIIDQPYMNILVVADRPKAEAAMNRLARGERVANLDLVVRRASGSLMTLELNAALGEDRIIYVVARDVTEQRAMEKTFQQHRTLFQIAGSVARIGGWIIDLQQNKAILSDEVCAIHQLPGGSVIDLERVIDLYVPECHKDLRAKLKQCMQQGKDYELRCQALNKSGERIWVRLMGKALRGEDGQVTHVQGAVQDISDSVRAENEVKRLADRLQNTLDSITDAFFSVDTDWRFSYINPQAERVLEREAADLLGQNVWDMFPEARDTELFQRYHLAMNSGESQHIELFYPALQRWLEISAYPFEEGLSVYFRDITDRKQSEERLHTAMSELERSNRELQDFAFIASHDLQEPLRKVQAFGERLEKRADQLDETGRDYLQRMRQASGRMQSLIQDLLSYSRVTTQGGTLQPVDLDEVLDGALLDLEATLEISGGRVEREPLLSVQGDQRQLGQLLQNLLSNALKFRRDNQAPVIRVYGVAHADGGWSLHVADNGIGFDEKYLDRIFNPFQRLHDRQQFSGTGIGLAIVRKIAERHQADITARSQPGTGSTFVVTFRPGTVVAAADHGSTRGGSPA